jgi:hypothetical protein
MIGTTTSVSRPGNGDRPASSLLSLLVTKVGVSPIRTGLTTTIRRRGHLILISHQPNPQPHNPGTNMARTRTVGQRHPNPTGPRYHLEMSLRRHTALMTTSTSRRDNQPPQCPLRGSGTRLRRSTSRSPTMRQLALDGGQEVTQVAVRDPRLPYHGPQSTTARSSALWRYRS